MSLTRTIRSFLLGAVALAAAGTAHAAPIRVALGIVIDGSGSIDATEFSTQISAYQTVLGDSSILPADGSVVVNVVQFSTTAQIEQTAIRISSEADRSTLLGALAAMIQLDSLTDIAAGIDLAVSDLDAFLATIDPGEFDPDFTKLIDVSTDGFDNVGATPESAVANAIANGYSAVNCLGIGPFADCSWNDGNGEDFLASSFADLLPVLEDKITFEITGDPGGGGEPTSVPAPATILLLVPGLAGLGLARRRRAEAA